MHRLGFQSVWIQKFSADTYPFLVFHILYSLDTIVQLNLLGFMNVSSAFGLLTARELVACASLSLGRVKLAAGKKASWRCSFTKVSSMK